MEWILRGVSFDRIYFSFKFLFEQTEIYRSSKNSSTIGGHLKDYSSKRDWVHKNINNQFQEYCDTKFKIDRTSNSFIKWRVQMSSLFRTSMSRYEANFGHSTFGQVRTVFAKLSNYRTEIIDMTRFRARSLALSLTV